MHDAIAAPPEIFDLPSDLSVIDKGEFHRVKAARRLSRLRIGPFTRRGMTK
ncbi:MAG: hypothetical protein KKE02_15345 [Alphaproteobacteria bacterium]|nr:hypothetical protein [Alphaproteobacteria bacterium]MBU1516781.1 hypothetical protein [Alphaproteobacteria bacterium]MBU2092475.1 hypothetical protein [Alphaproteobacteria bacterium]MBU2152394.1 hypothetical protein [Alphaproteobacteria bacterium]MBU2305605.1 hypothetical protein [Alphaproteobacteria bacterium]